MNQEWCKRCDGFLTFNPLGYGFDIEYNFDRQNAGEKQHKCPGCKRWRWPTPHPLTINQPGEQPEMIYVSNGSKYGTRICP